MKLFKILLISGLTLLFVSAPVIAGDFGWVKDFNIEAQADPSGIRARLAARFHLGDVEVKAILSTCETPADAYIILRFGEMSGRPANYVVEKYKYNNDKGWGVLAKSLGIKPGSEEFHALKRGHDLNNGNNRGRVFNTNYDRGYVNYVDNDKDKDKEKRRK